MTLHCSTSIMHLSIKIRTRLEHVNATLQNKLIKRKVKPTFEILSKFAKKHGTSDKEKSSKGDRAFCEMGMSAS